MVERWRLMFSLSQLGQQISPCLLRRNAVAPTMAPHEPHLYCRFPISSVPFHQQLKRISAARRAYGSEAELFRTKALLRHPQDIGGLHSVNFPGDVFHALNFAVEQFLASQPACYACAVFESEKHAATKILTRFPQFALWDEFLAHPSKFV
jgi:hypothetical protein